MPLLRYWKTRETIFPDTYNQTEVSMTCTERQVEPNSPQKTPNWNEWENNRSFIKHHRWIKLSFGDGCRPFAHSNSINTPHHQWYTSSTQIAWFVPLSPSPSCHLSPSSSPSPSPCPLSSSGQAQFTLTQQKWFGSAALDAGLWMYVLFLSLSKNWSRTDIFHQYCVLFYR